MDSRPEDTIVRVLEQLRPMIMADGGDIEFIRYEDNIVYVKMHGACQGCPAASFTLKLGVEEALRNQLPEIKDVVADD